MKITVRMESTPKDPLGSDPIILISEFVADIHDSFLQQVDELGGIPKTARFIARELQPFIELGLWDKSKKE